MTLHGVVAVIALALTAVVIFDFIRSYQASTNTGCARLLDAGRGSATILWSQIGFAIAAVVAALDQVMDWICQIAGTPGADDAIKSAIQQIVTPTSAAIALAVYALITAIARMRTLNKNS